MAKVAILDDYANAALTLTDWSAVQELADIIDRALKSEPDPVKVWTKAFRGTLHSDERMCPCAVLRAGALDLPPEVDTEVRRFFQMCLDRLVAEGLSRDRASELLSTITGAMIVANALGDMGTYDRATREALRGREVAKPKGKRQAVGKSHAQSILSI